MRFPLGDILRTIVNPKSWLGKILKITKGSKVTLGDHDILLNTRPGETRLDRKPHVPGSDTPK